MQTQCGAHCRTTGEPCKNPPVTDSTRCRMHGGKTPRAQARAAAVGTEREARRALADMDLHPVDNPLEALALHAAEVMALRDYLRGEVSRLESLRYQGGTGEQVRAELAAYQSALRDTTAVLTAMGRLNIDERLLAITQRQADIVVAAVKAGLAAVGIVAGEQRALAHAAVAAELRKHGTATRASVTAVPARRAGV
jgi:hypothetical protein